MATGGSLPLTGLSLLSSQFTGRICTLETSCVKTPLVRSSSNIHRADRRRSSHCLPIAVLLLTIPSTLLLAAVKTAPITKTDLATIDASLIDSTVEVEANVSSIIKPKEGSRAPVRIDLTDATGSISLVIWPDVFDALTNQMHLTAGDLLHVNGRVSKYRDEIQLTLQSATDLRVLPKPEKSAMVGTNAAPPVVEKPVVPLASVNNSLKGRNVTVQATISDIREPQSERAPFVITLTDGKNQVPMVFWSDLYQQVKNHIHPGNTILVTAKVSDYRGTLQLRLQSAGDIHSVNPTPPAADHKAHNAGD